MALDLLFDTETSGLTRPSIAALDKQPYVIEFYGMLVDRDTWQIVDELDILINVPVKLDKDITRITGLTDENLKDAPKFKYVANQIRALIGKSDRVVAHNLSFDMEMLDIEFSRFGEAIQWPEAMCTVEETEHLQGYRLSLTALHEFLFGEGFKGAHRARDDVQAMFRCYRTLVEMGEI